MTTSPIREPGIRERSPGVYEIRVHVGRDAVTGRLRQVSRVYRAPRADPSAGIREARAFRTRLIAEIREGKHAGPKATFSALWSKWLATKRSSWSPTTVDSVQRRGRAVLAALGSQRLDTLSARALDEWYAQLAAKGASASDVRHYHRLVHSALAVAVRWGWVQRNVATLASPPRARPVRSHAPTTEEVHRLIEEAAKPTRRNRDFAELLIVAAATGARRGELCGERFSDVAWDEGLVTIRRSVWEAGDEWGVKEPKSHQVRTLALAPSVMEILRRRWELQIARTELLDIGEADDPYVWSSDPLGMDPIMPSAITRQFGRIAAAAGVRCRFHDLRHFAGSELIAGGVDARTVADRLGHAQVSTTMNIYVTGRQERDREAAALLGRRLLGENTASASHEQREADA